MSIVEISADSRTKMRETRENGIAVLNQAQTHVFAALKDIRLT